MIVVMYMLFIISRSIKMKQNYVESSENNINCIKSTIKQHNLYLYMQILNTVMENVDGHLSLLAGLLT